MAQDDIPGVRGAPGGSGVRQGALGGTRGVYARNRYFAFGFTLRSPEELYYRSFGLRDVGSSAFIWLTIEKPSASVRYAQFC